MGSADRARVRSRAHARPRRGSSGRALERRCAVGGEAAGRERPQGSGRHRVPGLGRPLPLDRPLWQSVKIHQSAMDAIDAHGTEGYPDEICGIMLGAQADHAAHASRFDTERAWAGYVYVIVSIQAGKPVDANAFVAEQDGGPFRPEPLEVS